MNERYFTIVNPAAGGGRCGKLAPAALDKLRAAGLALEVRETRAPGEATVFAREAYAAGFRNFIAVGGDGTGFEIVNGLFPAAASEGRAALGFSSPRNGQFLPSRLYRQAGTWRTLPSTRFLPAAGARATSFA